MWERAEGMGGCLHLLCGSRDLPAPVGPRVREQGHAVPTFQGEGTCDSRAAGMGLCRTLCSFCNCSCGVCLQSVWQLDLQCFHMAKSFRCLQIPDSSPDNQLANQSNSLGDGA